VFDIVPRECFGGRPREADVGSSCSRRAGRRARSRARGDASLVG